MQTHLIPKRTATATAEETRKRRPRKQWRDQVEEDLIKMDTKSRQSVARDQWEWKFFLEARRRERGGEERQ
jgi:hypothetical protein